MIGFLSINKCKPNWNKEARYFPWTNISYLYEAIRITTSGWTFFDMIFNDQGNKYSFDWYNNEH